MNENVKEKTVEDSYSRGMIIKEVDKRRLCVTEGLVCIYVYELDKELSSQTTLGRWRKWR